MNKLNKWDWFIIALNVMVGIFAGWLAFKQNSVILGMASGMNIACAWWYFRCRESTEWWYAHCEMLRRHLMYDGGKDKSSWFVPPPGEERKTPWRN